MKKIKLLFIAAAALVSGSAMAQKIVCPDATFSAEGKANLVFSIADNTDETATLAEFTLALPEGVTIEKNSKGRYVMERGDILDEDHSASLTDKKDGGGVYFLTKCETGYTFTELNGSIVSFNVVAADGLADGTYPIQVTGANIVNKAAKKIATETSFTINVTKGATGIKDVNADGGKSGNIKVVGKDGSLVIKTVDGKEFNAVGGRTK